MLGRAGYGARPGEAELVAALAGGWRAWVEEQLASAAGRAGGGRGAPNVSPSHPLSRRRRMVRLWTRPARSRCSTLPRRSVGRSWLLRRTDLSGNACGKNSRRPRPAQGPCPRAAPRATGRVLARPLSCHRHRPSPPVVARPRPTHPCARNGRLPSTAGGGGLRSRHAVLPLTKFSRRRANENFARELLELHTLGAGAYRGATRHWRDVPGAAEGRPVGYVDADVWEAARPSPAGRWASGSAWTVGVRCLPPASSFMFLLGMTTTRSGS